MIVLNQLFNLSEGYGPNATAKSAKNVSARFRTSSNGRITRPKKDKRSFLGQLFNIKEKPKKSKQQRKIIATVVPGFG